MIKAIAHGKAEPIKACVFTMSKPGNDMGNEVSVDPVDKAGIDPEHIRHSPAETNINWLMDSEQPD